MFESFTKDQRRVLFLGAACVVLAIVATVEGVYILLHRRPSNPHRFQVNKEDNAIAFDSATGQVCKTFRVVRGDRQDDDEEEKNRLRVLRHLPGCVDIR